MGGKPTALVQKVNEIVLLKNNSFPFSKRELACILENNLSSDQTIMSE